MHRNGARLFFRCVILHHLHGRIKKKQIKQKSFWCDVVIAPYDLLK